MKMKTGIVAKNFGEFKEKVTLTVDDYIKDFKTHMKIGIEAIADSGRIYAEALRQHPTKAPEAFRNAFPRVLDTTWDMLEWIGNGDLNPNGYFLQYNIAKKVKHIPIEQQDTIFSEAAQGFKVLNTTTMKPSVVPIDALSGHQASLVIDVTNGTVRTIEEQRKVLADRPEYFKPQKIRNGKTPKIAPKYRICGQVVIINGIEIGREELRKILKSMDDQIRK